MPPVLSPKEEKSQLVPICNQGEFFMKTKRNKATSCFIRSFFNRRNFRGDREESKGVVHDKLLETSPPMEDIPHHGTSILHGFKDPFMRKECAIYESFNFFKFISPTISTWVQHVMQGMLYPISARTLKDLLHGSKPMNYESMTYVYGWIMRITNQLALIIN